MRTTIPTVLVSLVAAAVAMAADTAEPLRLSATIAGQRAVIEVRDQPREAARDSIRSAFLVIAETLEWLDTEIPESAVARLNAAAGQGPQTVDEDLMPLLQKSLGFCIWSQGATGPLGGMLYQTWDTADGTPTDEQLRGPLQTASCQNLELRPTTSQALLASGCRLDLRHFATGFAVDRAVERLRDLGAGDVWVQLGPIVRAVGPGAGGSGWRYDLPLVAGMSQGLDPVLLRDMSMVVLLARGERQGADDLDVTTILDQRTGRPSSGVVAVLLASPLAVDAQAIGTTMLILGNREGQLRLGTVEPAPSALWLLGDGSGDPLLTTYKWSTLGTL